MSISLSIACIRETYRIV